MVGFVGVLNLSQSNIESVGRTTNTFFTDFFDIVLTVFKHDERT